jgi:hypothetical protein
MKNMIILLFALLPFLAIAERPRLFMIDGLFENVFTGQRIRVHTGQRSIHVKGLNVSGHTEIFRRVNPGHRFINQRGFVLKILNRETFQLRKSRYGMLGTFVKVQGPGNRVHNLEAYRNRGRSFNLSGTWHTDLLKSPIHIEETRDGCRAKIGRTGRWTYYKLTREQNRYHDNRGNVLIVNNDQSLTWTGKGYKQIRLRR